MLELLTDEFATILLFVDLPSIKTLLQLNKKIYTTVIICYSIEIIQKRISLDITYSLDLHISLCRIKGIHKSDLFFVALERMKLLIAFSVNYSPYNFVDNFEISHKDGLMLSLNFINKNDIIIILGIINANSNENFNTYQDICRYIDKNINTIYNMLPSEEYTKSSSDPMNDTKKKIYEAYALLLCG
jgi:hypothetical protein